MSTSADGVSVTLAATDNGDHDRDGSVDTRSGGFSWSSGEVPPRLVRAELGVRWAAAQKGNGEVRPSLGPHLARGQIPP